MDRKRVGILVFPQVEVLDFCGPFEVFSVTRLNEELFRAPAIAALQLRSVEVAHETSPSLTGCQEEARHRA
jgi:hypothetical protein